MADSGKSEIGKSHYVKYDDKNMTYNVWHNKSEVMTAIRMNGCWHAVKNDYKDLIKKEIDETLLCENDKI